ncbi:D-glycero-D-manno-heptose 1-phosphate guanosyltransferase [Candidatus Velamenicoccus archaeovorus]|uniref:D-glycero-D-manno-heptose 1-phosphate guanosyltransferase n=1 Tax=Velamenicoccus archaeovorus TaxID=1930593 RepID=A0A410P4F0_VELA1|nr:sugar phosphate nucleotidyltransferase [Candidatus Velamenicoccus archaeovorus]QAT17003.1 D-glycero-D-manno-heptose 1-phosphate guanosyltransferase [Candidatus Velamenicoccus archaeovorus]
MSKNMQVVILAGGRGTRLGRLTDDIPKPMVPIHGKPFLYYDLQMLKAQGYRDILILTGYLGKRIEEYFKDGVGLDLHIAYSHEETPLGTGGALKLAENKISGNFILMNGDTLFPLELHELVDFFYRQDRMGAIAVSKDPSCRPAFNITTNEDGLVKAYHKKLPSSGASYASGGVGVFKHDLLQTIPAGRPCSLEEDVYDILIRNHDLAAYVAQGPFYDMGTQERLKIIREFLAT